MIFFMNYDYKEAVAYIEETPKFTTKNTLEHTRECLRRLGDPQKNFKVIHVAGTNGKGSTCAFITSILREAGYCCGLFTSPHLVEINERFQINEVSVSDEKFLEAFIKVKELADQLTAEGDYHPTYFEMLFLMGMLIFAEAKVDYVTLETGLGGRLDATTSIEDPVACVITSISLDHMQYLGNTVAEIAGEKAGIIVPGVPVIYDGNDETAAKVIRAKARELGSPAYELKKEDCNVLHTSREGIDFSLNSSFYQDEVFHIPFIARYQVMNGALALKTMEVLREILPVEKEQIRRGMKDTRWQGRMETICPGVIVDGAHNEDGVAKFTETAAHFQKDYEITLLFSAVSDKDYKDMIAGICKNIKFAHVVTTQIQGDRVVPAQELGEIFTGNGCGNVTAVSSVKEAFDLACAQKGDGLLFCVGSLYLIGEIKAYMKEKKV